LVLDRNVKGEGKVYVLAKLAAADVSMQRAEFEVFAAVWASVTAGHGSRHIV
jgi:hypothetical protein